MKHSSIPEADRPIASGYGIRKDEQGLLSWNWAEKPLSKSRQYFLTTINESSPHTMPIWGVWLDNNFWFSTGRNSRKARNLSRNKYCTVCTETHEEAVIVEGKARLLKNTISTRNIFRRINSVYKKKYGMIGPKGEPMYQIIPVRVFGFVEKTFPKTATRWTFPTKE